MNRVHKLNREPGQVLGYRATVLAVEQDRVQLDDGSEAALAAGCLLQPEPGDQVLVTEHPNLILSVLHRPAGGQVVLSVAGAESLKLSQQNLELEASEHMALRSLRDAELTAATGTLEINARNLFTSVLETLVEQAADRLAKVGNFALEASALLRLNSRHGVVTADEQIHIDAKQVHLG